MKNEFSEYTIEEIKSGYRYVENDKKYICNYCGKEFFDGEIHSFDHRFFDSSFSIKLHVRKEHGKAFDLLMKSDSKHLSLTETQKKLLELMEAGYSDNEIAKQMDISASTVRHQKFMFRERAKQAKMYLSVYELAFKDKKDKDSLVPVHMTATMVDDRYITTEEEKEKIIDTAFSSLNPLKLSIFPAKEKKKIIILKKITESFSYGIHYNEKELNQILKDIYDDYPTIRRYLIEYGFMERTNDCKEYWLK